LKEGGDIYNWFEKESTRISNKEVYIHLKGIEEEISYLETRTNRTNLLNKHYAKISYLQPVQLKSLPDEMIRLDQLAGFQDVLYDMSDEYSQLRGRINSMEQAFFVF